MGNVDANIFCHSHGSNGRAVRSHGLTDSAAVKANGFIGYALEYEQLKLKLYFIDTYCIGVQRGSIKREAKLAQSRKAIIRMLGQYKIINLNFEKIY